MRDWFNRLRDGNAFEGPFTKRDKAPDVTAAGKVRPHAYTLTRWMRLRRFLRALLRRY